MDEGDREQQAAAGARHLVAGEGRAFAEVFIYLKF
jgi:hypothetical protein